MDGESEFQKLGVALSDVRSVVTAEGSDGAVILAGGAACIVEHSASRASAITAYLRSEGIPVYGYDDDIPDDHRPEGGEVSVG